MCKAVLMKINVCRFYASLELQTRILITINKTLIGLAFMQRMIILCCSKNKESHSLTWINSFGVKNPCITNNRSRLMLQTRFLPIKALNNGCVDVSTGNFYASEYHQVIAEGHHRQIYLPSCKINKHIAGNFLWRTKPCVARVT